MKVAKLTLSFPWYDHKNTGNNVPYNVPRVYRVERITDSVEYSPGEYLDRAQVADLCASKQWCVTMTTGPAID